MTITSPIVPAPTGKAADFVAAVRDFARDYVRPRAIDLDHAPAAEFDWDLVGEGTSIGLMRMGIPKEFGGLGLGAVDIATVIEELAAADPGVALIFGASGLFQTPILLSGDARLQARYLAPFISDEPVLACNAVTEEFAGLDLIIPDNSIHAQNIMTARRDGDRYLLNGKKKFITNGPLASYASVWRTWRATPAPPA
jgi:alkylation response protein AidB-like acyl-CoA dehydrogenase